MPEKKQNIEHQNSCKISVSQKLMWSGEIKVYSDTIDNAVKLATAKANELSVLISEKNKQ